MQFLAGMKSRSRRLGLETVSRPDFECLGLVSGKSGKVSSRSRALRSRLQANVKLNFCSLHIKYISYN